MKATARASALASPAVLEFAKRIQRKRASLSDNPFVEGSAPVSTGRSFLQSIGLGKSSVAVGPELTLAKMLKEWRELDATYASMAFSRGRARSVEEKASEALKDLNNRIVLLEYRVFGNNVSEKYPSFNRTEDWLPWRLVHAHPDYGCERRNDGWKEVLFTFALEDSKLAFGTGLFS